MEEQRQKQWEEQCRLEQEQEEDRQAGIAQEEELRLEMQTMARRGYQDKVRDKIPYLPLVNADSAKLSMKYPSNCFFQIHSRPRSAWT